MISRYSSRPVVLDPKITSVIARRKVQLLRDATEVG